MGYFEISILYVLCTFEKNPEKYSVHNFFSEIHADSGKLNFITIIFFTKNCKFLAQSVPKSSGFALLNFGATAAWISCIKFLRISASVISIRICLYCFTFCVSLKPLTSIYNSFFFPHRPSGTFKSCTDWTVKVRK